MDLVARAVGSIVSKLGELLKEEYKLQKSLREQIEYLKNELDSAQLALCKVGATPPEQQDPQVMLWAREVREASYDMEDILDAFLVDVEEGAAPTENKDALLKRLKKKMAKMLKKSKARHDIASAIEDMKKLLQEVTARRDRYSQPIAVPSPATNLDPRLVYMNKEAAQIIGIERTRAELIAMLQPSTHSHGDAGTSSSSSSNPTKIVSVVGAGGLGKTTLAKVVYDELSAGYDCQAFVSVGRNPDLVQVIISIFFLLDEKKYKAIRDVRNLQLLIGELRKFLENKRYFIVIDDVWDIRSWQTLRLGLHQNNNGSRVVKTTRNLDVASGHEVYKLGPLSQDNSKRLFYMRLYGEDNCPVHHPEEASEKILHKCGGVPLAIITMASLLVGKSRQDWLELCSSPGFYPGRDNKQVVDDTVWILSLSYYDLPWHLKTCLLYLSVYPEDCEIEKDSLIWKWVAEGFIQKNTRTSQFEQGEEYFHQLINRSMIQGVESKEEGIIRGCRVHDMVLDLIRDISGEENFITISTDDGASSRHKVRRLARQNRTLQLDQSYPDSARDMTQLRSLVAHGCDIRGWALDPSLKFLRVLALERCTSSGEFESRTSPDEFENDWYPGLEHLGKLVHLRYLGIRDTMVGQLPESLGALKLLQTLVLEGTTGGSLRATLEGVQLPWSVCLLTRLVCLRCDKDTRVPDGLIQKMTSLQELQISVFKLSFESTRQFLRELGNLSLLRVLRVLDTKSLDESMQAELLKSLGNLKYLQHLYLGVNLGVSQHVDEAGRLGEPRHRVFGGIQFPCLSSFVNGTLVPNLCYLWLGVGHVDEAGLRALASLPDLRFLHIEPAYETTAAHRQQAEVVNIAAHGVFFPKLRSLELRGWMVQLATNDDSAGASLSIWWEEEGSAMVSDSQAEDGGCSSSSSSSSRVQPAPVAVMPNLHNLVFSVPFKDGRATGDNLGLDLECLPSLRYVEACLDCQDALDDDVDKLEAELRRLAQLHPNTPQIQISRTGLTRGWRKQYIEASEESSEESQLLAPSILSMEDAMA